LTSGVWIPKSVGTRLFSNKVPIIKYKKPKYSDQTHDDVTFPSKLSKELAEILGWYVAEGHSKEGSFNNHDPVALDQFKILLKTVFGANRNISKCKTYIKVGKQIADFLNRFVGLHNSAGKSVPEIIRRAPEKYQVAFLKALFEGDGSIWKHQKTGWLCEYSSISNDLIYQVKGMLENIGIICSVDECYPWATNGSSNQVKKKGFKLQINTVSFCTFMQRVGFAENGKKQATLLDAVKQIKERTASDEKYRQSCLGFANVIPANGIVNALYKEIERVCKNTSYSYTMANRWGSTTTATKTYKVGAVFGSSHHRLSVGKGRHLTRHSLIQIEAKIDAAPTALKKALRSDKKVKALLIRLHEMSKYIWTQVKSSVPTGKTEYVYDLSVPGPHSYHVNGLIGHNTASGLAISLSKTEEYCKELQDTLFAMFPEGADYLQECHKVGKRDLHVTTPLGMRRHLWGYMHNRTGVINAMNRRGPNSVIQGVASCIGIASIRLMQNMLWHFFVKHGVNFPMFTISNYVHDSCKSEITIHLLPIYLYMIEHASTTLVHKRFREVFGYKMSIGLELEFQIGPASSELTKWNFMGDSLVEIVTKTLDWQEKELGYDYKEVRKSIMKKFKTNWRIISDIRRKELIDSLKSQKPTETMIVNEKNARNLGFVI